MTTDKQIAANRQNAKSSTGPRTEHGKRRSRRNAVRHGLTAETITDFLEDPADYQALETEINADYRPRTNFELEGSRIFDAGELRLTTATIIAEQRTK